MSVRPLEEADLSTTSVYNRTRYPNPFFDLANNYIPNNIKTLFKFCRTFFYTNGFLRNVVTKLTEYPITDVLFETTVSKDTREKYIYAFNKKIKLKSFLIEIGLDYFTYGNCFISVYMKPRRFFKCSKCEELSPIDSIKEYKLRNFKLIGTCPKCNTSGVEFKIIDEHIKSIDNFKLLRYAPENIEIDFNPLTGTSIYYYNIPQKIKAGLMRGDKALLKEVPEVFLEALREKKSIVLDDNNLYHFKRPTLAEDDMGWGKPIILPALKEIYYLQTLKRGNEAISHEHVVPKKSIFPANTTTLDPYTQMNLGKWRGQMEEQIKKWKTDPNHIGIFPIPIGYQELGGNARALLLTPEMKFIEESIINSLGVPIEFVKGGTTWTGSSISLRIVENHFLTYRELLLDFVNFFLIDKLVSMLKYPKAEVKFKKFKMSDDAQEKQLAVELSAQGKISDARLLDEFGLQYDEEQDALRKGRASKLDETIASLRAEAEAQGEAMVIQARYQTRARIAAAQEELKAQAELFQEELAKENMGIPEDPLKLIEKFAFELLSLPPEVQEKKLIEMANKMPTTYALVIKRMQTMQLYQSQELAAAGFQMEPVGVEQNPPYKPKQLPKVKTKGATRGEP
jgi:hypothetical protein